MKRIYYVYLEKETLLEPQSIECFLQFLHRVYVVCIYSIDERLCLRIEKEEDDFEQLVKEASILGIKLYKDRDKKYGTFNEK